MSILSMFRERGGRELLPPPEPVTKEAEQPPQSSYFMDLLEDLEESPGLAVESGSPLVTAQVINGDHWTSRRVLITLKKENWNDAQLLLLCQALNFSDDKTPTSIMVGLAGERIEARVLFNKIGQELQPQLNVAENIQDLTPYQKLQVADVFKSFGIDFFISDKTSNVSSEDNTSDGSSTAPQKPASYFSYNIIDGQLVKVDRYDNPIPQPPAPNRQPGGGADSSHIEPETDPNLYSTAVEQISKEGEEVVNLVNAILERQGGLEVLVKILARELPPAVLQETLADLQVDLAD